MSYFGDIEQMAAQQAAGQVPPPGTMQLAPAGTSVLSQQLISAAASQLIKSGAVSSQPITQRGATAGRYQPGTPAGAIQKQQVMLMNGAPPPQVPPPQVPSGVQMAPGYVVGNGEPWMFGEKPPLPPPPTLQQWCANQGGVLIEGKCVQIAKDDVPPEKKDAGIAGMLPIVGIAAVALLLLK